MANGAAEAGDRKGMTRESRDRRWFSAAVSLLAAATLAASSPAAGPTAAGATAAGPAVPLVVTTAAPLALASAAVEPPAPLQEGESVEGLQRLLSVLGYYAPDGVDGVFDGAFNEETIRALKRLQRRYGLAATGQLDAPTMHLLGDDGLAHMPRFAYTVRRGDRLSLIARRFGSRLPWIARINPRLESVHLIVEGEELIIPVDFPLPRHASAERMQVLRDRFLGSYSIDIPFMDAGALVQEQLEALRTKGFEASPDAGGVEYGITLRGRGVVLGRIEFSAGEGGEATRMDIGLLFSDDPAYGGDFLGRV